MTNETQLNSYIDNLEAKNEALEELNKKLFEQIEDLDKELALANIAIDRLGNQLAETLALPSSPH